eukprot:3154144-Pyramimonas_sp.AAC.1
MGGVVVNGGQAIIHTLDVNVGVPGMRKICCRHSHPELANVEVDVGDAFADTSETLDAAYVPL